MFFVRFKEETVVLVYIYGIYRVRLWESSTSQEIISQTICNLISTYKLSIHIL